MLPKHIKWLDPFVSLKLLYQVSPFKCHLSLDSSAFTNHANLFQLADCLQWRIQNEIDHILAVSFIIMGLVAKHDILYLNSLLNFFISCFYFSFIL